MTGYSLKHLGDRVLWESTGENSMNKVIYVTLGRERQVFTDVDLIACIREANRLNAERGYVSGVHVVELDDGQRMTAADCKAAA